MGLLHVNITHNNRTYERLPVFVIQGKGVNLIGRNWLYVIQLDWCNIFNTNNFNIKCEKEKSNEIPSNIKNKLNAILLKYQSVFEDKIGTMSGYKAKVYLKDVVPKFAKARNVPIAMEHVVTAELERLINEGVLRSIPFSYWACPIVIVPKPDGRVRICGDFKRTVNLNIETETYPTPTNDEIFSKVRGGKRFSRIDLRQAYL